MSRIKTAFENKAKVAYLTAGDGKQNYEYFRALLNSGVNILEIGIPYSDPVADGPAIQLAMQRALDNNTTLKTVFDLVKKLRKTTDAAIILFTYFSPIQKDLEKFLKDANVAGADGVLVVDLPYEEGAEFRFLCEKYAIAPIMVAAPSTSLERIKLLASSGNGFLYYACYKGTTGMRDELPSDLTMRIAEIKANSKLPVAIGFGVSNNKMVQQILNIADGCVIGSYFVNAVAKQVTPTELESMAREVFTC